MLTKDDLTVADALEVYDQIRHLERLRYVGFKDVGLPTGDLQTLTERMHDDGRTVMLEVVSESKDDEVRSVRTGLDIGVDWMLGGTHAEDIAPLVAGSGVTYCPFPGTVVGHPSKLRGSIPDIVASAKRLAAMPEVGGLDLLAYRHDGDVEALVRETVAAVDVPLIAAGSIREDAQIRLLAEAGVWGFTIGGAVFEGKLPAADTTVPGQLEHVLDLLETLPGHGVNA